MKRSIMATIAYLTAGSGVYYTIFAGYNFFGLVILIIGLLGYYM